VKGGARRGEKGGAVWSGVEWNGGSGAKEWSRGSGAKEWKSVEGSSRRSSRREEWKAGMQGKRCRDI